MVPLWTLEKVIELNATLHNIDRASVNVYFIIVALNKVYVEISKNNHDGIHDFCLFILWITMGTTVGIRLCITHVYLKYCHSPAFYDHTTLTEISGPQYVILITYLVMYPNT